MQNHSESHLISNANSNARHNECCSFCHYLLILLINQLFQWSITKGRSQNADKKSKFSAESLDVRVDTVEQIGTICWRRCCLIVMISSHRSQAIITQQQQNVENQRWIIISFLWMGNRREKESEIRHDLLTDFAVFFCYCFPFSPLYFSCTAAATADPPRCVPLQQCIVRWPDAYQMKLIVLYCIIWVCLCVCARWTLSFHYDCLSSHRKQFPNWNWNSRCDNGPAHHYSHTSLFRFKISISANLHLFFFSFYWLRLSLAVWLCTSSSDAIKTLPSLVHNLLIT